MQFLHSLFQKAQDHISGLIVTAIAGAIVGLSFWDFIAERIEKSAYWAITQWWAVYLLIATIFFALGYSFRWWLNKREKRRRKFNGLEVSSLMYDTNSLMRSIGGWLDRPAKRTEVSLDLCGQIDAFLGKLEQLDIPVPDLPDRRKQPREYMDSLLSFLKYVYAFFRGDDFDNARDAAKRYVSGEV